MIEQVNLAAKTHAEVMPGRPKGTLNTGNIANERAVGEPERL
jgi:hypothetical protein